MKPIRIGWSIRIGPFAWQSKPFSVLYKPTCESISGPADSSTLCSNLTAHFSLLSPLMLSYLCTFALGQSSTLIAFSPSLFHTLYSLANHQVQVKFCMCHEAFPDAASQAEGHLFSSGHLILFIQFRNYLCKDIHSSMVIIAKKRKAI